MTKQRKPTKSERVKQSLIVLKQLAPDDWRGLLAIIVTVGGLIIIDAALRYGKDTLSIVLPSVSGMIMMVLAWYFKDKGKE